MEKRHLITINGRAVQARHGEILLDAALRQGVSLPYDCRAGHCGTCCVRLVAGEVDGGAGSEAGVVHACKCRVVGDAEVDTIKQDDVRSVAGEVVSLVALSQDVWEVGVKTEGVLPFRPGQYAQLAFEGFPARPFSITLPIDGDGAASALSFHIRRMPGAW